jgi:hypothetical protein
MTGRQRPGVDEALRMIGSYQDNEPAGLRRLLNFQAFVSTLLIVLVLITGLSFAYALRTDREARTATAERQVLFENHVASILTELQVSNQLAHNEREDIIERVEDVLVRLEESF